MAEIDPYVVLGVARTASREEIARAYRRLAKVHHPDAGAPPSPTMARINEAWHVLGSTSRRAGWDREHTIAQPPHWAAVPPTARSPMRPPPPVPAGPASVRDTAWFAIAVVAGVALLLGGAMIGISQTAVEVSQPRSTFGDLSIELPEGWVAYDGDGIDPAGHGVIAHLLSYRAAASERCQSFADECPLSPDLVPPGEASVVVTHWTAGTPPVPDPVISRPFGADAERIIGGEPAAFELRRLTDGAIAWWQLSPPGFPDQWIEVTASIGGGGRIDQDRIIGEIDQMLQTLRFAGS